MPNPANLFSVGRRRGDEDQLTNMLVWLASTVPAVRSALVELGLGTQADPPEFRVAATPESSARGLGRSQAVDTSFAVPPRTQRESLRACSRTTVGRTPARADSGSFENSRIRQAPPLSARLFLVRAWALRDSGEPAVRSSELRVRPWAPQTRRSRFRSGIGGPGATVAAPSAHHG
jgi:hypothetical protein